MLVIRKKSFVKKYDKLFPKLKSKVEDTLLLLAKNSFHPNLRNHALQGDYKGYRSIDVTGDIRIIFRELSDGTYEIVELVDVGTHSQLY